MQPRGQAESTRLAFGVLVIVMTPTIKFILAATVVTAATVYLAYVGAASSWRYYLSVDEVIADATHLMGKRLRVSGRVEVGSLAIVDDRRQASFELAGLQHKLYVTCRCSLPDNLTEDIDVVVEGILRTDGIHGNKVITRCASKYQSRNHDSISQDAP